MPKEMFISSSPHETKVAVLEDDQLVEVYFERDTDVGLVGGIYKGRVNRVLPGMQSAFVDIGLERDAFLYVSDFFLEDQEELDTLIEETESRVAAVTTESHPPEASGPPPTRTRATRSVAAKTEEPAAASAASAEAAETTAQPAAPPTAEDVAPPPPPGSSPASATQSEAPPVRRPEHRGRHRRGRRRGGFGEHRFTPRPEPPREQEPQPPRSFEILPGESLAKYQQDRPEAPPGPAAESPGDEPSASLESAAPAAAEPSPVTLPQEPVDESRGSIETSSAATDEPQTQPSDLAKPDAEAERSAMLPTSPAQAAPPASSAQFDARYAAQQESRSRGGLGVSRQEAERAAEAYEAPSPVTDSEAGTEPAGTPEGETAAPAGLEPSPAEAPPQPAEPEAHDYTLREPAVQPRFAQRRGRRGRRRGGRQHRRPEGRREAPRSGNQQPVKIADLLKEGQEILVQIAKEPLGTKGARITSHIALPGRYLVYMPTITHIGISRKIGTEQERLRLRNIILEHRGSLTGGFIVRTAGEGRSEEEFKADLQFLTALWNDIRTKAEQAKAPALIYRDLDLVQRVLRDILTPDFKSIRADSEVVYERALDFVSRCQPSLVGQVKLHTRSTPIFEEHGIQAEIEKALKPKVWLKSGGYIVINQTEALVAIDVNTGKYVGRTNRLEDTILKTNIDAVNEIVRQIRLRDLGGIIVIDFIDMDERRNRNKVIQAMEEALRRDRAPSKLLSFNDFGLVAITRKRVKQSLERTLCEPCPYCNSSGWVKSVATVSNEIFTEAQKMAREIEGRVINLRVNPEIAHALRARGGALVSQLESLTHKEIIIKSDPAVHQERFEIF